MKLEWSRPRKVLLGVLLLASTPAAADGPAREYVVKAAFLYNFTQFVTWPNNTYSSADAPFVVAVLGDDPFDGALEEAMQGKTAEDRPIVVKHFASTDEMGPCQVLFVPQSQDSELPALFGKLGTIPVLTVGESEQFLPAGGGIRFLLEDNRIRFEISPAATDAARLKVSAKLMKLARIYQR
ncbi:MAG TPA: YfiR family protein [Tepidisphaeraceae bacterium]|nr:YfiR family protein [Tepidisphaeraceae bacterium]